MSQQQRLDGEVLTLEITSDGRPTGTIIRDVASGRIVSGVHALRIEHRAGSVPNAEIEFRPDMIQSTVTARCYLAGVGYIRAVELEDGTRVTMPPLAEDSPP